MLQRMRLQATGREAHSARRMTAGHARSVPQRNDFPNLQRLRTFQVQEDRQDLRNAGEINTRCICCGCCSPARPRCEKAASRCVSTHTATACSPHTWRTVMAASERLAQGTAPRFRARFDPDRTARTPRLQSGQGFLLKAPRLMVNLSAH